MTIPAEQMPAGALEVGLQLSRGMPRYHRWMYNIVKPFLGRRVIDIGCGIGNDLPLLLEEDRFVLATDLTADDIGVVRNRFSSVPADRLQARRFDIVHDSLESVSGLALDTVFSSNVLEHIEHDQTALARMYDLLRACPPDRARRVVLVLPALPFLYGHLDQALGHYRRYTKRSIAARCAAAGFVAEKVAYMNFFGIVSWFVQSYVRRTQYAESQTGFVEHVVPALETLERWMPPPIGLSVIYIGRVPGGGSGDRVPV